MWNSATLIHINSHQWFTFVYDTMKLCDMEDYFLDLHHSLLIKSLRFSKIGSLKFDAEQYGQVFATLMLKVVVINSRLYRHFKKSFKLESYLTNVKNHLHRKAFCQFRISATH